jgi:hypothetical protein
MDVKSPNTKIPIAIPAHYQLAIPLLQHASHPSAPVSTDDIVDCVELRSGRTLPAKRQVVSYRPSDSPPNKNKGQIIDTWI